MARTWVLESMRCPQYSANAGHQAVKELCSLKISDDKSIENLIFKEKNADLLLWETGTDLLVRKERATHGRELNKTTHRIALVVSSRKGA